MIDIIKMKIRMIEDMKRGKKLVYVLRAKKKKHILMDIKEYEEYEEYRHQSFKSRIKMTGA